MLHEESVRIAPSVLDADFGRLAEQIALVEAAGAAALHLDIMDGHFVPNLSIGVPVVASIRRCTRLFLDTHLMITDPLKYAPAFVDAGSQCITFHIEVIKEPRKLIRQIRALGVKVGVSLNPDTPVESVLDLVDDVDVLLVMTVFPGFGGQRFMTQCLSKIEVLAKRLRPEQWLEVDGGINAETAPLAVAAGANTLVAGSAVFGAPNPALALRNLRSVASGVRSAEQTA
jgi:ribulose-phosphate 3-epimerase